MFPGGNWSIVNAIVASANGQDFYTFKNIKQVVGHTYTPDVSTDGKTKTVYSLTDNTAGGPPESATNTDKTFNQWSPLRSVKHGDEFHNPTTQPIKRYEFSPISTTLTKDNGQIFKNPTPIPTVCANTTCGNTT
jgi:hypothetical protein